MLTKTKKNRKKSENVGFFFWKIQKKCQRMAQGKPQPKFERNPCIRLRDNRDTDGGRTKVPYHEVCWQESSRAKRRAWWPHRRNGKSRWTDPSIPSPKMGGTWGDDGGAPSSSTDGKPLIRDPLAHCRARSWVWGPPDFLLPLCLDQRHVATEPPSPCSHEVVSQAAGGRGEGAALCFWDCWLAWGAEDPWACWAALEANA